jgi:DNA polymerase III alpha subunit
MTFAELGITSNFTFLTGGAHPERRLTDILTCIREGLRVEDLGTAAQANAEQRLRSEAEMRRIFDGPRGGRGPHRRDRRAAAIRHPLLRYEYPSEIADGESASDRLTRLAKKGLEWRYPEGIPERAQKQLDHELRLIAKLNYEPYFLTVHDIVAFARARGILCQGRGSAANSITCYALGVTSVSPEIGTMVFERFVSEARERAARHRRRFRARAARGGDPAHLRTLRPPPRGAVRHGHPLPRQARRARGRQGHGPEPRTPRPRCPRQIWGSGPRPGRN